LLGGKLNFKEVGFYEMRTGRIPGPPERKTAGEGKKGCVLRRGGERLG
jgi:hypothetical protein